MIARQRVSEIMDAMPLVERAVYPPEVVSCIIRNCEVKVKMLTEERDKSEVNKNRFVAIFATYKHQPDHEGAR